MSTQIQRRRGTTTEHNTFTGVEGELTVDTTKDTVVVHDGATTGGRPLLREDQANLPTSVTNGISVPSANNVAISTNGTGRLFVDASGNVGVGAASPSTLLTLAGSNDGSTNNNTLRFVDTDSSSSGTQESGRIEFFTSDSTQSGVHSYIAGQTADVSGNGAITFGTGLAGSATERLRITSDGKLGLGTSSPDVNLHVNSSGKTIAKISSSFSNSTTTGLRIDTTGDSSTPRIDFQKAGVSRGVIRFAHNATSSNEQFSFNVGGGTDKLVITGAGNVGIGTTSPAYQCVVEGSNPYLQLKQTGTNTGSSRVIFGDADTASPGQIIYDHSNSSLQTVVNGTECVRIDSSGNLGIATNSPGDKLEIGGAGAGIILASPDGTRYRLTVANGGTLSIAAV